MTLKDRIKDDMKTAMKAGDSVARSTLTMLLSVIQNRELEKRSRLMKAGATKEEDVAMQSLLSDDEIISAISSEVKKRADSISVYQQAGRTELAAQEEAEQKILSKYMPEQRSEEDVRKIVADVIAKTGASGAKNMGAVMGAVSSQTKGRFPGARLQEIVKSVLGV